MSRKPPLAPILIFLLLAGGSTWSLSQRELFAPVDSLVAEKRYTEAIDLLRSMLISSPDSTSAIKDRIAKTQLLLADEEIAQQQYNEALTSLSLFWAQYPERADEAQKRLRKINQLRDLYNKKAKALLTYMTEAKNRMDLEYNKSVTRQLAELEALDRNNPDAKKTLISLKETSLALINQDEMRIIMTAGRASIDKGNYVEATREYLKGFALFKQEFEDAGHDQITKQAVAKLVRQAESAPGSYEALQSRLVKSVSALEEAFKTGSLNRVAQAMPEAKAALGELETLRESVFATGESFARSYETIPKEGKSPIEYQYLAYLDIFTRGRPDSFSADKKPDEEKAKAEGLGGAILVQTEGFLSRLQKAAEACVDASYAKAERDFDSGAYSMAKTDFAEAASLVGYGGEVLGYWSRMPGRDFVPELAAFKSEIVAAAIASGRIAQLGELALAGGRLAKLRFDYSAEIQDSARYIAAVDASKANGQGATLQDMRSSLDRYRSSFAAIETSLAIEAKAATSLSPLTESAAKALGDDRPRASLTAYMGRLNKASGEAQAAEFATAAARARFEGLYLERELALRTQAIQGAEDLIEGPISPRPERARAGYHDPSPSSSSIALTSEESRIAALADWARAYMAAMDKEGALLRAEPAFAAARTRLAELALSVSELQARRAAALAKAIDRKKTAASDLEDARTAMGQARTKLDEAKALIAKDKGKGTKSATIRKSFDDSQSRLERSLAGVIESSKYDFDAKTWDDFQKTYASMNEDLGLAKKNYTIDETFRLLGEGQTYYEQALFDLAGESLSSAQELWRSENDTDQEQVKYWQNLVKQASDTNNKREVRQSDALYYEISSYLSEARRYYLKGDGLMKTGRSGDANAAFDSARQSISFVTRAFPLNAEAGLLTLQILKSTDSDAYKKSLPRRIQEAVSLLATDASSGYSRIADLYRMEPNYPGLKATLEKAEIKVGKRRAPPSKEDMASASKLVTEAEKLLKSGRKDDAAKAEASLNNALGYEPTNKRALSLLRDLKTLQGKTSGPTLELADQAVLDEATRSFAAREYNQARDLLAKLLSDPDKRTRDVLKLDNDLKTLGYD